jgi:hypothetical protein
LKDTPQPVNVLRHGLIAQAGRDDYEVDRLRPWCIEIRVLKYLTKRVPNRDPRIGVGLNFNEGFPPAVFNGNVDEILLTHDSWVPVFALE